MMNVLVRQVRAFFLALQFLTTLPTPRQDFDNAQLQGLSLLWYPAVGLLLGVLLTLACSVLPVPFYLQAVITVALWVVLTGGLHLDGVADCTDAWFGGLGDREKTLRLLKDPLCGSMGVTALIMLVALKIAALAAIISQGQLVWLWSVPLLARLSLLLLFLTTPYVRAQGLGDVLAQHFSRAWAKCLLVGVTVVFLLVSPVDIWAAFVMATLAIFLVIRAAAARRLGGFTGDVAGAQVEWVEVGLLLVLASRSVA
ncbi:Adenosylcobinamide-GDP ribazoletransferase [Halioglobus japonicus]|nr:Adenosylcobinamide-GDP ribazoletransferase [Halioglobus japonicus]